MSIQGEGPSAGVSSVFLRLALCNLHCTWCDTRYTWDWEQFDPEAEVIELPIEAIEARVTTLAPKNLVVTGGEPMLQQRPLAGLISRLKTRGFRAEVETNGTVVPEPAIRHLVDQWNVSPKLESSDNSRARRELAPVYRFFSQHPEAYFKFVITNTQDLNEVEELVARYDICSERVILMPEATQATALHDRSSWIVQRCIDRGFRFSTRLQVLLWGGKRGA